MTTATTPQLIPPNNRYTPGAHDPRHPAPWEVGPANQIGMGLGVAMSTAWPGRCGTAIERLSEQLQRTALAHGIDSVAHWASLYLSDGMPRYSPNTVEAKARDLDLFLSWFAQEAREMRLSSWTPSHTRAFVSTLHGRHKTPATINRALATLKHFARWCQDGHGAFAAAELPTRGISNLTEDELPCKKLSTERMTPLIAAARQRVVEVDRLRTADSKGRALSRLRPRRDLALLLVLAFTGLRVQEAIVLRLAQFKDGCLWRVARKSHHETPRIYLHWVAREALEDYILNERGEGLTEENSPIFLSTKTKSFMSRDQVARAVGVSPHIPRHTFGAWYREVSGSDAETAAALSHRSLAHVGRYTRKTDKERDAMLYKALERCT